MLEVTIHDIRSIKVAPDSSAFDDKVKLAEKEEHDAQWYLVKENYIVILKEKARDRYLPIWIGPLRPSQCPGNDSSSHSLPSCAK